MTIKAEWLQAWKAEDARPYSDRCAHAADVVFIDGQIKLMKAHSIRTWKELCYWNFASSIKRHLQDGVKTVVLAFDDYALVPSAKNMTQSKRVRHVPPVAVHRNETLPATIPENWAECIMNRTFKTKVIRLITEAVPGLVQLQPGQRLIIDHAGHPVEYTVDAAPRALTHLAPLGEADVKFPRYAAYGRMIVEATDGDYVPIALLFAERCAREGAPAPDMSIYRMSINLKGPKRTAAGDVKYTYEFLHVNALFAQLRRSVLLKLGRAPARLGPAAGYEMHVLAALVSYTGCDFSKGLPHLGPRKIWDNLGLVWGAVAGALRPAGAGAAFDVDTMVDKVVARLYCVAFRKHVGSDRAAMAEVARRLKEQSPLAASTRARLPDGGNVACVVRNGNWVLAYWACADDCPDPLRGDFGFARDAKGRPCWQDALAP